MYGRQALRRRHGATLKGRILVPFVLVLIFVVVAFLGAAYIYQERSRRAEMNRSAEAAQELMHLQIDSNVNTMHAAIDALINDPTLREAMEHGDHAALMHRISPALVNELRDRYRITYLAFLRTDRVTLLRVHAPGKQGDVVDRVTVLDATSREDESSGLELSVLGTLTLRVVVPWRDDQGKVIGYVEAAKNVAQMADEIHRVLGVDVLMLVHKEFLDRTKWEEGQKRSGRQDSWDQLSQLVPVAATIQAIPGALAERLEEGLPLSKAVISTDAGRRVIGVTMLPLNDVSGRELGSLVVARDVTAMQQVHERSMMLIVIVTLFAGIGVCFLYNAVLHETERSLRSKQELDERLRLLSSPVSELKPNDLSNVIHEALSDLPSDIAERVTLSLPSDPVVLSLDRNLVSLALADMLITALETGASLQMRLQKLENNWRVDVLNDGAGLPEDDLKRLFQPFVSFHPDGISLGLVVVRHVADLHGGGAEAVNRAEGGLRFSLWFPLSLSGALPDGEEKLKTYSNGDHNDP